MKKQLLLLLFLLPQIFFAHAVDLNKQFLKHWHIEKEQKFIDGSLMMVKNGEVYIEDEKSNVFHYPLTSLSAADQNYANQKIAQISALNNNFEGQKVSKSAQIINSKLILLLFLLMFCTVLVFKFVDRKKMQFILPIVLVGFVLTLFSFTKNKKTLTDPSFMTAAFAPFASTVSTSFDGTYFYVNTTGIPSHTMMVGIGSNGWQQQVPMKKCFINNNKWSIPLNPVLAQTPVIVNGSHFTKGAIAMATNGVPIFNPYTNTGADAFLTGQLDNFGGHCGRGDDYHYHTAPLHLLASGQTNFTLPIAFGLDGYAVYGNLEPTGIAMEVLDSNHGHFFNNIYHYHGTPAAPYMIGKMVGVVTEDTSLQIVPQPQGAPVRTENWGPLNGALITSCIANASNGYNTSYSINNVAGYATNYIATVTGLYTFSYVTPTGTTTTTYNGPAQCIVPNLGVESVLKTEQSIILYPNPTTDILNIDLGNSGLQNDVRSISIYDLNGRMLQKTLKWSENINVSDLNRGTYFVKIQFVNSIVTKKLAIK